MNSRQYWNRRYLFDKAGSANTGEDFLVGTVAPLYKKALEEIEKEIEGMYGRFADQEKISLAEAKQKISRADFKKIDFGARARGQAERQRELAGRKDSLPEAVVEAMESRHRKYESALAAYTKKGQISRLELLHVEIEEILLDMYDENQANIYEFLADQYRDGYYRAVFRNQQMAGFGKNFAVVNEDAVRRAVLNFYGRNNYSDALWKHCRDLSHSLRENITIGLIRTARALKRWQKESAGGWRSAGTTPTGLSGRKQLIFMNRQQGRHMENAGWKNMNTWPHWTAEPAKHVRNWMGRYSC